MDVPSTSIFLPVKKKTQEEKPTGPRWESAKSKVPLKVQIQSNKNRSGRNGSIESLDPGSPGSPITAASRRPRTRANDPPPNRIIVPPQRSPPSVPLLSQSNFGLHLQPSQSSVAHFSAENHEKSPNLQLVSSPCPKPAKCLVQQESIFSESVGLRNSLSTSVTSWKEIGIEEVNKRKEILTSELGPQKSPTTSYSLTYLSMPNGQVSVCHERRNISALNNSKPENLLTQAGYIKHPPNFHYDEDWKQSQAALQSKRRSRPATAPDIIAPVEEDPPFSVQEMQPSLTSSTDHRSLRFCETADFENSSKAAQSPHITEDPVEREYFQRIYRDSVKKSLSKNPKAPFSRSTQGPFSKSTEGPFSMSTHEEMELSESSADKDQVGRITAMFKSPTEETNFFQGPTEKYGTHEIMPKPAQGIRGKFIRGDGVSAMLERQVFRSNVPGTMVKSLSAPSHQTVQTRRTKDMPFVVHNTVMGWKLTTPINKLTYLDRINQLGYDEDHAYRELGHEDTKSAHSFEFENYLKIREAARVEIRSRKAEKQAVERTLLSRRTAPAVLNSHAGLGISELENEHNSTPPAQANADSITMQDKLQKLAQEPYLTYIKDKKK